jgi:hypothetical protein
MTPNWVSGFRADRAKFAVSRFRLLPVRCELCGPARLNRRHGLLVRLDVGEHCAHVSGVGQSLDGGNGLVHFEFVEPVDGSSTGSSTLGGTGGIKYSGDLLSFVVDTANGGWWFTLFTAILGAAILFWLLRLVRRA